MDKSFRTDPAVMAGVGPAAAVATLQALSRDSGLRPLQLGGKELIPVVQGGMGLGVSAGGLAGGGGQGCFLRRRRREGARRPGGRRGWVPGATGVIVRCDV